ncbi:hypothetical protein AB3N58_10530 [Leptospira sp. WS60.C2]
MLKKLSIIIITILITLNCHQRSEVNRLNRKQIIDSNENEKTEILNIGYQDKTPFSNSNLRFRFLPYIESKNESINTSDLLNSYNFLVSYDQNLFYKLESKKFEIIPFMDQYHKVELDLRYDIYAEFEEKFYPTLIFMIQHGNVWPGITSFKGVGLKILIRLSIFDKSGNEIAFCQKKLFDSIFSNDFFENHILMENSPFFKNLNDENFNFNNSPIFRKISECKKELKLTI